jgi:cellobiose phosphorylase
MVVSHNGGGFSFFDDAQHNVLTRWDMDLVRDCSGKFLYLSDVDSGEVWSLAPSPCRPVYDSYECVHTLGATTFRTQHRGIHAEWTLAVAPRSEIELWRVVLTNRTDRARRIRIASYLEWCCGVAPDSKREFHKLFLSTRHDAARDVIIATKSMWDIPPKSERDHWNIAWPYAAAHAVVGKFDRKIAIGDKSAFLGRYGSVASPLGVRGKPGGIGDEVTGFGRFGDGAAALGGEFAIRPGASVTVCYLIAIASDEAGVSKLIDTYRDEEVVERSIIEAQEAWERRVARTTIESEAHDFDLLNNYWLPYQAISGRLWGRTGYYQQSGAFGFRDQLQDSQVWLPLDPAKCREQILFHATRQFVDGSVNHWWHALADFGNHTECSDDYLWLPFLVANYLRETGDYAILDEGAAFRDDPASVTLLEHCKRSIARAFARTSPRGLPLIGSCDWNDGLSALGLQGKGESVWLAMFLCDVLAEWTAILSRRGGDELARDYTHRRDAYLGAINTHAWDGQWYRCATKDCGEWLGSDSCVEGKIHLNPQTWSILAGVAPPDRLSKAWQSVKDRLLMPFGPLLLSPAHRVADPDIGYITRYSPGSRENGGVYMHAATWALMAACKLKDRETTGRIWKSISPPVRGQDAEAYGAEPFVTPGNVDGPLSAHPGKAGWTWYTGSAAWLNRVSLEWILGIRPVWTESGEGLLIDPCPPAELGKVSVVRTWRGVPVRVKFDAAEFGGEARLTVNGRAWSGCVLPSSLVSECGAKGIEVKVDWPGKAAGALEPKIASGKVQA